MYYGLADCNNFFVSCERVFNPALNGKPVVVLSGNDGCVIARSNEAKALGIPMGCPTFQIKNYTNPRDVVQISARHHIYYNMSQRVMHILGHEADKIEVYSVDEAFFTLPFNDAEQIKASLNDLTRKIQQYVGIPVSIGFATSRTLAKLASHIAKKSKDGHRVEGITTPEELHQALSNTSIDDVWGIGRKLTAALRQRGVFNALSLTQFPTSLLRSLFSIQAVRTQQELKGIDCVEPLPVDIGHKSIMNSRTFGRVIYSRADITEAVVNFAAHCAKQLRDEHSMAQAVTVYLRGDRYRQDLPFYENSCLIKTGRPLSATADIVGVAIQALTAIFREGFAYRKAGVMVSAIVPEKQVQPDLFHGTHDLKNRQLMKAIDNINDVMGDKVVTLATQTRHGDWQPVHTHQATVSKTLHFYTYKQY